MSLINSSVSTVMFHGMEVFGLHGDLVVSFDFLFVCFLFFLETDL